MWRKWITTGWARLRSRNLLWTGRSSSRNLNIPGRPRRRGGGRRPYLLRIFPLLLLSSTRNKLWRSHQLRPLRRGIRVRNIDDPALAPVLPHHGPDRLIRPSTCQHRFFQLGLRIPGRMENHRVDCIVAFAAVTAGRVVDRL
jgi:hypothetical protein